MMDRYVLLLLLASAAYAGTITSVSCAINGVGTVTQTGTSSCQAGPVDGSAQTPRVASATATATTDTPGVANVTAEANSFSYGTAGSATASASFEYTLELTGGTGEVLVISGGSASCQDSDGAPCIATASLTSNTGSCGFGNGSMSYCFETFGVPFTFTGLVSVSAFPLFLSFEGARGSINLPISGFRFYEFTSPAHTAGQFVDASVLVLADVPEPATFGIMTICVFLGGSLMRREDKRLKASCGVLD